MSKLTQVESDAPSIIVTPPGPKSRELLAKQTQFETRATIYPKAFPFAIESAKNSTIKDVDGNLYIDWMSGICVLNLGHNNPVITKAVDDQIQKVWHALEIPTEVRIDFLQKIHSVLPNNLRGHAKVLFTVTGGDACEAAMSLARYVTKKKTIIAFSGSYHGIHQGVVGATSSRHYLEYSGTTRSGVFHVPYPYSYRFPFPVEKKGDEAQVILRYLEHLISDEHSGLDDPAGIIVEPVQGEGGYIVPPADFLPGLKEISQKYQIPLIVDEVQSGFGRTGKFWGCEATNSTPDIMCISKSVGAGLPLSLIAYHSEYDSILPEGFHLGTYRGNPLALAAGAASIDYIARTGLLDKVQNLSRRIIPEFERIGSQSKNVGDVRGLGFMIGNEIVKTKDGREPSKELAVKMRKTMFENGLLMHTSGHYGNVLRFMAPLTISEELLQRGLVIYERSVKSAE
ncbi:MAG: aspartate aminotransferase family protein [Nitrososphaerota archaeon]|nr:aspartate aminotransferase family protein [Nitrososphaerota archaeon]